MFWNRGVCVCVLTRTLLTNSRRIGTGTDFAKSAHKKRKKKEKKEAYIYYIYMNEKEMKSCTNG